VIIPIKISTIPPVIDIHFRNSGALARSQPVTPPNIRIGEIVVPKPNKTAMTIEPAGSTSVIEVVNSKMRGVQIIKPRVKPNVKAPKSMP
jgi:hypothetical protein